MFNYSILIIAIILYYSFVATSLNPIRQRFARTILAVGRSAYKIQMTLGKCKNRTLYVEQKIWEPERFNRVLDIYYKSSDRYATISRVDVFIIVGSEDCFAYTDRALGMSDISATVVLPVNGGLVFYRLVIYTCANIQNGTEEDGTVTYMPYLYTTTVQFLEPDPKYLINSTKPIDISTNTRNPPKKKVLVPFV